MEKGGSTSFGSFIGEVISMFVDLAVEMATAFWSILPKAFSFTLWVLSAVIILPCVLVANHFFPKWVKWGEGF